MAGKAINVPGASLMEYRAVLKAASRVDPGEKSDDQEPPSGIEAEHDNRGATLRAETDGIQGIHPV